MRLGLASPLMFVPEIQGAQSLSVLEVNTPWRGRDILIPEPAKTWRGKLTLYQFFSNSLWESSDHSYWNIALLHYSVMHVWHAARAASGDTYHVESCLYVKAYVSPYLFEFMQFKHMKVQLAIFAASGFLRANVSVSVRKKPWMSKIPKYRTCNFCSSTFLSRIWTPVASVHNS